jgi:hypothetical protein
LPYSGMVRTPNCRFGAAIHACTARALVGFASLALLTYANAYELHDPVSMVMRTAMGKSSMAHWGDVKNSVSPTFGVNSQAWITPEFQKRPLSTESEFRVAFSFSRHRFETDFVQIADGVGGFVQEIVFDIEFVSRDVRTVRHHVVHFDPPPLSPPETIKLRYVWHELPSADSERGVFAIFLIGVVAAVAGAAVSFLSDT